MAGSDENTYWSNERFGMVAKEGSLTTKSGVKLKGLYVIKNGAMIPDGQYVDVRNVCAAIDDLLEPGLNRSALLLALEAIGAKEAANLINTGLFDLPANLEDK